MIDNKMSKIMNNSFSSPNQFTKQAKQFSDVSLSKRKYLS